MNGRLFAASVAVLSLVFLAGCFGGGPSQQALSEDRTYNWDTTANATYEISRGGLLGGDRVEAVYDIRSDRTIELYRRGLTSDAPVRVSAVKYRTPNGTVRSYGDSGVFVEEADGRTRLIAPEEGGQLAVTLETRSRSFELVTSYNGSQEVVLPRSYRVGDFLLGDASPGGFTSSVENDTQRLRWETVDGGQSIVVRYYVQRDRYVFYGMIAGLSVVGLVGYVYYSRLISRLEEWRNEQGLDIDGETDTDGRDPPPGMD
jgi:hypothetical protein